MAATLRKKSSSYSISSVFLRGQSCRNSVGRRCLSSPPQRLKPAPLLLLCAWVVLRLVALFSSLAYGDRRGRGERRRLNGALGKEQEEVKEGGGGALDATQGLLLHPEKTKAPEKEGGRNEGGGDHRWSTTDHPSKRKRAHPLSPQICLLERKMYFGNKNCSVKNCTMSIELFLFLFFKISRKRKSGEKWFLLGKGKAIAASPPYGDARQRKSFSPPPSKKVHTLFFARSPPIFSLVFSALSGNFAYSSVLWMGPRLLPLPPKQGLGVTCAASTADHQRIRYNNVFMPEVGGEGGRRKTFFSGAAAACPCPHNIVRQPPVRPS